MRERLSQAAFGTGGFHRCRDEAELASRTLALLAETFSCEGGVFFLREEAVLRRLASLRAAHPVATVPLPGSAAVARALEGDGSFLTSHPGEPADAPVPWADCRGERVLVVPCADADGRVRAVIGLYDRPGAELDDEERGIAELVAAHASEALLGIARRVQVEASERTLRQLVENELTGIAVFQSDRVVYANPRIAEMLGRPGEAGAIFGHDALEYIHPADRERLRRDAHLRLAGEALSDRDEIRLMRADGGVTWAEVLLTVIQHEDRPALLVHAIDASARRSAEEEKQKLEARFLQAQKMEAIGRLAGGVAHDFNNLLMAISGHTELLARHLPEPHHAHLTHIRKATELAAGLTRQLLAFSRKQVLQTEIVNLNDVVTATHKLLRRIIGEDVALELRLDPAAGPVRADPSLIGQVLMNLGVNARDAMPSGGTLTLETAGVNVESSRDAGSPELVPGRYVQLSVSDSGVGMAQDVLDRLFEPFFTTKEGGKGTGLGLAMVYGTVSQSGGHISVESAPGRGSTFRLHFPEAHLSEGPPVAEPPKVEPLRGSETILVVEDAVEVRELLESMLAGLGYRVFTASDARTAERIFAEQPATFQLLLSDVVLPGASGPELCRKLRALRPGLAVLYTSGYLDEATSGRSVPGDLLLRKPFSHGELASAVRRVLDRATKEREARLLAEAESAHPKVGAP